MIGGYDASVPRPGAETWSARYELTADHVVDTAVALVARHGFKGVSMTRIADELGVTTPALYHHFADKRQLLDRAADRIVSLIEQPPADAPWTERLRALILDQERVLRSYPGTYRYLIDNPTAPARLRFMDIRLRVLDEAGFTGLALARAFATVAFFHSPEVLVDDALQADLDAVFSAANRSAAASSILRPFPHVEKHIHLLLEMPSDEYFRLGLDELISSLRRTLSGQNAAGPQGGAEWGAVWTEDLHAPQARYRQVAARLREAIQRGEYAPGQALPSQPELARRFGLNQTSINRAIALLGHEGLVRVEQGRGAFVQERPVTTPGAPNPPAGNGES